MKKLILIVFVLFQILQGLAQNANYQWPIKGAQPGKNILYRPQSYIDIEFNFGNLFIGANEDDTIVSPVYGKVIFIHYGYQTSLHSSISYHGDVKDFETDSKKIIAEDWDAGYDKKYLNVGFSIEIEKGVIIYIAGLRPIKSFKTGVIVNKGDLIGTVGYVYSKIQQPAISISISKNGKSADPMTPFGLKTTFIPYQEKKQKELLTAKEMQDDLKLFVDALKEGYPGLYDYISAEKFDSLIKQYFININEPHSVSQFEVILKGITGQIRDSHLVLLANQSNQNKKLEYMPSISFGWLNDSLVVNGILTQDTNLYGKRIIEVDGIPADSLKQILEPYTMLSGQNVDGYSKSISDFRLLTVFELDYLLYYPNASKSCNLNLKFADGQVIKFDGVKMGKSGMKLQSGWKNFYSINMNKKSNFSTKILANKIAYLGLSNFKLYEVEIDQVTQFIDSIADSSYQNLIIDVRNNPGGEENVISQIYSLIAKKEFRMGVYKKVNKTGNFGFFKNCLNYSEDLPDMFNEYSNVKGKSGYYLYDDSIHKPHPNTNFEGRVYVLANERSFSAAAFFPALVHKYKRGVIVGRETPSTYYHMNAEKFADLQLSNSQSTIHIPLVQIVFDTLADPKIPWGRGVIPDYPVNLSLGELAYENGDSILNYTLNLINDSIYFPVELKILNVESQKSKTSKYGLYLYVLIGGLFLILTSLFMFRIAKMRKKN